VIARLAEKADLVFVASSPVLSRSDAATIARHVDAALLVLGAGKSRRDDAAAAREILERAGTRVLGVVLTGVDPSDVGLRYFKAAS
jgi:Mrp family chromosome partitioning ATPase